MYSFDFNGVNENITKRFVAWLMKMNHLSQMYRAHSAHCTQQTLFGFPSGHRFFPLYSVHYSWRYAPWQLSRWAELLSPRSTAIWPDSMQSTVLLPLFVRKSNNAANWSGHYLFILLKLHCSLNARYAGDWRLIDWFANCGKHMRQAPVFSLLWRSFIHK